MDSNNNNKKEYTFDQKVEYWKQELAMLDTAVLVFDQMIVQRRQFILERIKYNEEKIKNTGAQ